MFVRWKRRKALEGDSLDAVIVENQRDGQRVRQRVVCYLGSIHERAATEQRARVNFWRGASKRLNGLNLARPARKRLEAKLSETIEYTGPRETARYEAAAYRRIEAIYTRA